MGEEAREACREREKAGVALGGGESEVSKPVALGEVECKGKFKCKGESEDALGEFFLSRRSASAVAFTLGEG